MQRRDNFFKKKRYKGRKNYMDKPQNIPEYFVGILHVKTSPPPQYTPTFQPRVRLESYFNLNSIYGAGTFQREGGFC